jgi:large conductance mechanosensitive channel
MFQGFKQFMLRGNVLDLAVAVVMGAAFGAVVTALVKDLITPLIAAIIGEPDFSAIEFTVNGGKFLIGDFINAVVSFLLIGAAVYFFIVPPVNPRACGGASRRRTRVSWPCPDDIVPITSSTRPSGSMVDLGSLARAPLTAQRAGTANPPLHGPQ